MTYEEQKCIQHLKNGIDYKRNGEFQEALDEYEKAFYANSFNPDIYKNIAKIYMVIGQPDYAMRNILVYAHFRLLNDPLNMAAYDFAVNFYDWTGRLNDQVFIQEDLAIKAVANDFNLAKIVADLNLTFWAGFCFIRKYRSNLTNVQIPAHLLNNYMESIMGQTIDGPSLSDSSAAPMIRATGLAYLLRNLITHPTLSKKEIIDTYLQEDFDIDHF